MRCQPGDLAVIALCVNRPDMVGRLVTVLHAAPTDAKGFQLPDGKWSRAVTVPGWWVCEFATPAYLEQEFSGAIRATRYAAIQDAGLRPLRDPGDDARDQLLRPLPIEVAA